MPHFSDLSEELLVLIFENLFTDGWISGKKERRGNLGLRLVSKTFDRLICPLAFGALDISQPPLIKQSAQRIGRANQLSQQWLKRLVISKLEIHQRRPQPTVCLLSAIQAASLRPSVSLSSICGLSLGRSLQICRDALCLIACVYREPKDVLHQLQPSSDEDSTSKAQTKSGQTSLILGETVEDYPSLDAELDSPLWLLAAKGDWVLVTRVLLHAVKWAPSLQLRLAMNVAVRLGRGFIVNLLLAFGAYALDRDSKLDTLLHHAVWQGNLQLVHLLLEYGADVSARNRHNVTPLGRVDPRGDTSIARELLRWGADPNVRTGEKYPWATGLEQFPTLLVAASFHGNTELVQLLLRHGVQVDPDPRPVGGSEDPGDWKEHESALATAIEKGRSDVTDLLLEAGADPSGVNVFGETTLMLAARHGDLPLMQQLIDRGMQVNQELPLGQTALDHALLCQSDEAIVLLIDNGARVNAHHENYLNYIGDSIRYGGYDSTQLLLEHVVLDDVSRVTHGDLLLDAAFYGDTEVVQSLLDRGVPVDFTPDHVTALHMSTIEGNRDTVQLLLERGADVNLPHRGYGTPLQMAVYQGNLLFVRLFLQFGSNVEVEGPLGTPLRAAVSMKREDIVRVLLDEGHAIVHPCSLTEKFALHTAHTTNDKVAVLLRQQP